MNYSNQILKQFVLENYETCLGIAQAWGLEIKNDIDMYQVAEYLLDQI